MHESPLRKGDYVLSKVKDTILEFKRSGIIRSQKYGNLNISLDIGNASDYMKIFARVITEGRLQDDLVIGTGVATNLYSLCRILMIANDINPEIAIEINKSEQTLHTICHPIVDVSWLYNEFGTSLKPLNSNGLTTI